MTDAVVALVTTKPDAEMAADLKVRLQEALAPVATVMAEASRSGFLVQWDAIAPDQFGRFTVHGLRLVKHF